jgi:acetylornithine deacetylase
MNNIPDLESMMRRLIEIPSISSVTPAYDSGNIGVINQLANWLEPLGFDIHIYPLSQHPSKANLVATLGNPDNSEGLVLSGHTDTVPCDPSRWKSDPFTLDMRENRFYGLGTVDMKGFFAVALTAIEALAHNEPINPLTLVATADEESSMSGAKALLSQQKLPGRYAIIGEATGLQPVHAHKGMMMDGIRLIGKSGHSSDPRFGNSALEGMHQVMTKLLQWRQSLQQDFNNPEFAISHPTLNFGYIKGGDNPNRICGECEMHVDLRPLPGMNLLEMRDALKEQVKLAIKDSRLEYEHLILFDGIPPMHTDLHSEIVTQAESVSGQAASTVAYATEGPYLNDMGLETIIMGPGSIRQAHQPDEYLSMEQAGKAIDHYSQLIHHFCYK